MGARPSSNFSHAVQYTRKETQKAAEKEGKPKRKRIDSSYPTGKTVKVSETENAPLPDILTLDGEHFFYTRHDMEAFYTEQEKRRICVPMPPIPQTPSENTASPKVIEGSPETKNYPFSEFSAEPR